MGNKNKKIKERWDQLSKEKHTTFNSFVKIKKKIFYYFFLFINLFFLIPIFFLGNIIINFFYFFWKKLSLHWFFRQIGRLGLYIFFKYASKAGVILWLMATGATDTILAFPLFFYFILPPKFTKKYFGLSWGFGFLKTLIGFTGWLFFFAGFLKSL